MKQDHLDLKIMVIWKVHATLQASAGGGGLDFEISYLDIVSQRNKLSLISEFSIEAWTTLQL